MRLRAELGDDAFWIPPRLWAYAADNQPDGDFSSYSDQELSMLIGYSKDATRMLEALKKAGFLDADRKIHDWEVYNSYHRTFSERAKNAANAKWRKEKKPEMTGEEMRQACLEHPTSIQHNGRHSPPKFISELKAQIDQATKDKEQLKNRGAHCGNFGVEWHDEQCRLEFAELTKKIKSWKKEMMER